MEATLDQSAWKKFARSDRFEPNHSKINPIDEVRNNQKYMDWQYMEHQFSHKDPIKGASPCGNNL